MCTKHLKQDYMEDMSFTVNFSKTRQFKALRSCSLHFQCSAYSLKCGMPYHSKKVLNLATHIPVSSFPRAQWWMAFPRLSLS